MCCVSIISLQPTIVIPSVICKELGSQAAVHTKLSFCFFSQEREKQHICHMVFKNAPRVMPTSTWLDFNFALSCESTDIKYRYAFKKRSPQK